MIYHNLYAKSKKQFTTVGVIGTGNFGTTVIIQSLLHSKLRIPVISDKNIEAIKEAYKTANIPEDKIAICTTAVQAKEALLKGFFIGLEDPMLLMELPVDIIAEATGNPEAGAKHALAAIEHGKHIVMVNKETDSCVGPILKKLADEKGVVYSPIDGDQHGALIQMVEWARDTGLEIISAGKSRDAEFIYDKDAKTVTVYCDSITIPKTVTVNVSDAECAYLESLPEDRKIEYIGLRKKILKALDERGGFDLCEMVIAANATGLKPDIPELHDVITRTSEIPKLLCEKKDGGILTQNGVIEVLTNIHEPLEAGLGGGVFLVVRCENPYSQMILATKGCLSNSAGSISLVYRPYHLCGVEAPTTFLCAGLLDIATGPRNYEQSYDIVQRAKVDLKAGDIIGNDHDERLYTLMVPMSPISKKGPAPAHMINGRKLICDVPAGTIITYDMVEKPVKSILWKLRELQDHKAF